MSATTATKPPVLDLLGTATFHRLTVPQYHQMIANGILPEGEPIELLEGYLVEKMSRGTPHDNAMDFLDEYLPPLMPSGWFARSQRAITLADSEPEPDYAVVRGPRGRYRGNHPLATDVGLVIEVSDSSLPLDRNHKGRIYARAGIPVYWVVNVVDKVVEVYTQPSGPGEAPAYAQRDLYAVGSAVPVVFDGTAVGTIPVADVMG
jgi:Uma2 family endonuclease